MKIKLRAICDIGKERANNEDNVAVCPNLEESNWDNCFTDNYITLYSLGALSIVTDGMGGANAGEIASSLAVECLKKHFTRSDWSEILDSELHILDYLREGFVKANNVILEYVVSSPDSIGLGTTVVLAWILGEKVYVAWCGDSRCYCFNPNAGLKLLTKDHSLIQEMIDKGEITPQKAFNHPDNNIITRCLGDVDAISEPDICSFPIKNGDIYLLCSDGLSGYCKDSLIEKTMYRNYGDLNQCQDALLKIALDAGGEDNISICLCALSNDTPLKTGIKGKIKSFCSKFR